MTGRDICGQTSELSQIFDSIGGHYNKASISLISSGVVNNFVVVMIPMDFYVLTVSYSDPKSDPTLQDYMFSFDNILVLRFRA